MYDSSKWLTLIHILILVGEYPGICVTSVSSCILISHWTDFCFSVLTFSVPWVLLAAPMGAFFFTQTGFLKNEEGK